ncbi:hypothetical protein C9J40_08135 [Photobacterium sp. GB-72]|nr:hypothetical protein C9J40_08135 [Photobacterium sp. GB-72]
MITNRLKIMNSQMKQLLYSLPLFVAYNVHAVTTENNSLAQPQSVSQPSVQEDATSTSGSNVIINKTESQLPNDQYNNTVVGSSPVITGSHNVGLGTNVNVGNYSLAVGDYSHAKDNSESIGTSTNSLNNGVAIGTQAYANDGLAIGTKAYATNNSIAIGNNSKAEEKNTVSFGGEVVNRKIVNGKIQVTDTDLTRRLTNVSAGINATDAVNVSQLTKAKDALQGEISHNSENISNNTNNIKNNTSDIKNNTANIHQNTQAIDVNKNSIANNETNIRSNTQSITNNKTSISNNANNITNNSQAITTNKTEIADNSSGIKQNTVGVNNNKIAIGNNSQNITTNSTEIHTNANNISQLHQESVNYTNSHVLEYYNRSKQYTDEKSQQTLQSANNYTDQRINQLSNTFNEKLEGLQHREDAGVASAMAMAAITVKPNRKYNIGMGLGYYGDQDAIALAAKINTSPDTIMTLDTSYNSNHNVGVAAGMTFGFN